MKTKAAKKSNPVTKNNSTIIKKIEKKITHTSFYLRFIFEQNLSCFICTSVIVYEQPFRFSQVMNHVSIPNITHSFSHTTTLNTAITTTTTKKSTSLKIFPC